MDIPHITFVTENGTEVKRYYNKYIDSFGGKDYADVYDANVGKSELREINSILDSKPKTYKEYMEYIQSNKGEQ